MSGTTTDDLEQSSCLLLTSMFHAKLGDGGEPLIPGDCQTQDLFVGKDHMKGLEAPQGSG